MFLWKWIHTWWTGGQGPRITTARWVRRWSALARPLHRADEPVSAGARWKIVVPKLGGRIRREGKRRLLPRTAEEKLSHLALGMQRGKLARVELELHEWLRRPGCPIQARILLAASWARQGKHRQALDLLHRLTRAELQKHMESHVGLGQLLLGLEMALNLTSAAQRTAAEIHRCHGHEPAVKAWLTLMQAPGLADLPRWSQAAVEQLAHDLLTRLQLLPSLVTAQKAKPDADRIQLLRMAGARMARDVHGDKQVLGLCQAMAELALLAGDADDARRWAHRGLKLDPYCASLALVVSQIKDDELWGPAAVAVLAGAAEAHPEYADVQLALIRRETTEGHAKSAQRRLEKWLERDPNNPLALALTHGTASRQDDSQTQAA